MLLRFTVKGNGIDPTGNPKPKIKKTARQHWTKQARDYVVWKRHVASAFCRAVEASGDESWNEYIDLLSEEKPITPPDKMSAFLFIEIELKNNKSRPDGENVFGSIADALFKQDKYLSGAYFVPIEPIGKGAVHVTVALIEDVDTHSFNKKLKNLCEK